MEKAFKITNAGDGYYSVDVDRSRSHGILHVTNEISITLRLEEDTLKFVSAWEIGSGGDWDYKKNEVDEFEHDHPGLLDAIRKQFKEEQTYENATV